MKSLRNQKGQVLLIIVLVMAVGLTVGLAVVSRSITDIKISRQEEESARAFSAAEAGLEKALIGEPLSGSIGGIEYNVVPTTMGGENEFVFPKEIGVGDTQTFWLVGHDESGNLTESERYTGIEADFYWGNEDQASDQPTTPALEVSVTYKDGSSYKVARGVFDPYNGADPDRNSNGFDDAEIGSFTLKGKNFRFRKLGFPLPGGIPYLLRLKLLYNDQAQILGVAGTSNFPSQGSCYESTAKIVESGVTRRIQQCQFYKAPPAVFDYVLYSQGDLAK